MAKQNVHEEDLVSLFKTGDERAFNLIYESYWQLLYLAACKILKDEDEAKDVVQEVFLSLLKNRKELDLKGSLSHYLYSAVRYKVLDFISHKKIRTNYLDSLSEMISQGNYSTDRALIEKEIQVEMEKEIQNLPPKMKEVFQLSRKEGKTHKEIAEELNISDKTVKKQINNAIKLIKPRFTNYYSLFFVLLGGLFKDL